MSARRAETAAAVACCVLLLTGCARTHAAASVQCDGGEVNFELLTGYAASPAAKHAMREQLALFTLPQCIDACKSDDQCAAVTYETGACVSYAAVPQKNANSGNTPVHYGMYILCTTVHTYHLFNLLIL